MHDHHHDHSSDLGGSKHRLGIALFITLAFMAVEVAGGILFNSLALLADAGHMLSDVASLGLSWVAFRIGQRAAGDRHTFGFRRSEILAALCNGLLLWAVVAVILYEAIHRFYTPVQVKAEGLLVVAALGLAVNLAMAALLFKGKDANLNVRSAFL
ncbi:MAG: cation diffusion facilitator family transporter, partial [Desulfomonile sp.]|nr:cation diffusion facilitator family transporter [Desulfomonile sp.]